jgi:hypothetical protein
MRSVDYPSDPFLHVNETNDARTNRDTQSVESIAAGVLRQPELLREIFRRLAWLEKEQLEDLREAIDQALKHREEVLAACTNGHFGRDYVLKPALEAMNDDD